MSLIVYSQGKDWEKSKPKGALKEADEEGEKKRSACEAFLNSVTPKPKAQTGVTKNENVTDKKKPTKECNKCKSKIGEGGKKLKLCSGCKDVYYCSIECQKSNWKEHKPLCKKL